MSYKAKHLKPTKTVGRKRILFCLLAFIVVTGTMRGMSALAAESDSIVFTRGEYIGYCKELDPSLPDSFSFPLYVRTQDEAKVADCYNLHKQFPPPDTAFDEPFLHNYFRFEQTTMDVMMEESVKRAVYNGFPNNASGLQGVMINSQFRAVTQAAIWYLHDKLLLEGN